MVSTSENPYRPPAAEEEEVGRQKRGICSRRAQQFAMMGATAGVVLGFGVLAIMLRSWFQRSELDDAYSKVDSIDFLDLFVAFIVWLIALATLFGVVGGLVGFVLDLLRPKYHSKARKTGDSSEVAGRTGA
jgi:hypothetical protein